MLLARRGRHRGDAGLDEADYSQRPNAVLCVSFDGVSNDGEVGEGDK